MKLNSIDCKILAVLQEDGRTTAQELANRVGLSPSPCARRVRLLEEAGVISGYAAVIDQAKVGLPISVFASIKLERQREEELNRFSEAVRRWPEVVDCYLMTGQRDYLLRIVVPNLEAYEKFLKHKLTRLEGVASIESSFALGQIKRANALPLIDRRRERHRAETQRRADESEVIFKQIAEEGLHRNLLRDAAVQFTMRPSRTIGALLSRCVREASRNFAAGSVPGFDARIGRKRPVQSKNAASQAGGIADIKMLGGAGHLT